MSLRARLVGLGAGLLLVGILAAVPIALVTFGGGLIPHAVPTLDQIRTALGTQDDGTLALAAVTVIAWLAWAVLALSISLELVSRLRGVHPPRLPGLHLPQLAARQLVATAALVFVVTPHTATLDAAASPAYAVTAPPAGAATAPVAPLQAAPTQHSPATHHPVTAPPVDASRGPGTYTVRRGDSLSRIARDQLGDANRWPDIVALNPGLAQDPDLIYPGTVLHLPGTTAATAAATAPGTYTVRRGDSLSWIARDHLGDANRWPDIVALNPGLAQDPDLIYPGTALQLPGTTPATAAHPVNPEPSRVDRAPASADLSSPAAGTQPAPATGSADPGGPDRAAQVVISQAHTAISDTMMTLKVC